MDNRDIDKLVAEKVMGWKVYHRYPEYSIVSYKTSNNIIVYIGDKAGSKWHPTEDILAAWQVFEWLEKRGIVRISNGDGDSKDCDFLPNGFQGIASSHISADSYPLAICLAALKCVGIEIEEEPANTL